ncbi:hypothetical protein [Stieleria varia]|nr:hypothetical protein [Stieleria varia]
MKEDLQEAISQFLGRQVLFHETGSSDGKLWFSFLDIDEVEYVAFGSSSLESKVWQFTLVSHPEHVSFRKSGAIERGDLLSQGELFIVLRSAPKNGVETARK